MNNDITPNTNTVPSTPVQSIIPEPPAESSRLPFWFYILFAVVAIIFLTATFLLAKTILDKKNMASQENSNVVPSIEPVKTIPPTAIPTPADQYLNKINNTQSSDEVASIESDLNATDLTELKGELKDFDLDITASPTPAPNKR